MPPCGRAPAGRALAASGAASLTAAQRARAVLPAYWRGVDFRSESKAPLCADRLAGTLAEALLPPEERAALEASPEAELEADAAGAHGAFIDRMVLDAVGRRLRQVVLLGSGLDCHAYRLDLPPQLKILEVDEAAILSAKQGLLEGLGERARCIVRHVPASERFAEAGELPREAIAAALDVRRPSLFVLGGLLDAWPRALYAEALGAVASIAGSGSRLLAPIRGGTASSAEARAALEEAGWSRVDVVGEAALKRLFPRAPPDSVVQLLVAERGAASSPGRPPPTRTAPGAGAGGPVEAKL